MLRALRPADGLPCEFLGTLIGRSIVRSSWKARGILEKNKNRKISLNYTPRISSEFTGLRIVGTF